jgi:hypothetical protein
MSGDCIHQLDLCPTCEGPRVTRLDRIPGVDHISIEYGDGTTYNGPAAVYIGPVPEDCPTPPEDQP